MNGHCLMLSNTLTLYQRGSHNLWTDTHIAQHMLKAHLDYTHDAASRNIRTIQRTVTWIDAVSEGKRTLIDLGCGPGIYTQAFADRGYTVTGVDISAQFLSGGRFLLGIGAGWHAEEYHAYGYDFPPAGVRVQQLVEALQIIKALWTTPQATFTGTYYRVKDAYCEPKPNPVPPLMVGAPRQLVEQMRPFIELGVDYFMVDCGGFPELTTLELLVNEVIPALNA